MKRGIFSLFLFVPFLSAMSVSQFKKISLSEIQNIRNNQIYFETEIEGYYRKGFECPPCPPEALCEACAPNYFILSEKKTPCNTSPTFDGQKIKTCETEIAFPTKYRPDSFKNLPNNSWVTLKITLQQEGQWLTQETPEDQNKKKKEVQKNKDISKQAQETLKKNPHLTPTKRPDWLKDIPGDSYEIK